MSKTVYLTIDDAPSSDSLHKLNYLTDRGIFAVWFCQGNFLEARPLLAREIIKRGHWIGNHTYSHPYCSALPVDQVFAEIRSTEAVINDLYRLSGVSRPHKLFRFPYGDKGDGRFGNPPGTPDVDKEKRRAAIQSYLRLLGYVQFPFRDVTYPFYHSFGLLEDVDWYWTYDSFDWTTVVSEPPEDYGTPERILARLDEDHADSGRGLNSPVSADIVLVHDYPANGDLFERIIDRLIEKGVTFAVPAP